jgi:hypothetical protein
VLVSQALVSCCCHSKKVDIQPAHLNHVIGASWTQAKAEKIIREAATAGANVILLQVHGS